MNARIASQATVVFCAVVVSVLVTACVSPRSAPSAAPLATAGCPDEASMAIASQSPYAAGVKSAIGSHTFYPQAAAQSGQSGRVLMCVELAANGSILRSFVSRSSDYPLLDGAALLTVGQLESRPYRLPDVPESLLQGKSSVWLSVPVDFVLNDDGPQGVARQISTQCMNANKPAPIPADRFSGHINAYAKELREEFSRFLGYPISAAKQWNEGKINLCISADAKGRITAAQLLSATGDPTFDGTAMVIIGTVAFYFDAVPPKSPPGKSITIILPVSWEMR